jgi:PAS domain-containing protein
MYFKVSMRHNPAKGFIDGYYRLVESYRNAEDRICHRTMLNVGFLDMNEVKPEQLNQIQKILTRRSESPSPGLFEEEIIDPVVSSYVETLYERLVSEKKIDTCPSSPLTRKGDWQTIDLNSLRNRDVREIGSEWLCYQALKQLKISDYLANRDWEENDIRLALTHIISRAVYPAPELRTGHWIRENSSVCELTGYPLEEISKDRLYRITLKLYEEKANLENYLSLRTGELFDIEDKIILYDLTNTYCEGRMSGSRIAKFGRSKEKRTDARLIVLALVVNPEGFIKYSSILEGNVSDSSTLEGMINGLRLKTSCGTKKAIVVMDAGIATESNLLMLKEKGYDYLCVTRSTMKHYLLQGEGNEVTVTDKSNRKISLQKVTSGKDDDYCLKIASEAKKKKECSMNERFREGFETGLRKIANSLGKKGGVKQEDKVYGRIGRLKQKYPSIHRHFDIHCEAVTETKKRKSTQSGKVKEEKRIVTSLHWNVKDDTEINSRSGVYFLRTSLKESGVILWQTYNTIREIEYTNRVLKTDLDLRPIYHKKDDTSMAHLHLGLLAYWVVNTVRFQLGKVEKDINKDPIHWQWKEIVRIMNTQKAVTTLARNNSEEVIEIRRCTYPDEKARLIYDKLGYRYLPYKKKKSVVHKTTFEKKYPAQYRDFNSS